MGQRILNSVSGLPRGKGRIKSADVVIPAIFSHQGNSEEIEAIHERKEKKLAKNQIRVKFDRNLNFEFKIQKNLAKMWNGSVRVIRT